MGGGSWKWSRKSKWQEWQLRRADDYTWREIDSNSNQIIADLAKYELGLLEVSPTSQPFSHFSTSHSPVSHIGPTSCAPFHVPLLSSPTLMTHHLNMLPRCMIMRFEFRRTSLFIRFEFSRQSLRKWKMNVTKLNVG